MLELLVEHGANIDALGKDRMRPLTRALMHRNFALACFLLDKGSQPHQISQADIHPLRMAFRMNNEEAIALLLSKGARSGTGEALCLENGYTLHPTSTSAIRSRFPEEGQQKTLLAFEKMLQNRDVTALKPPSHNCSAEELRSYLTERAQEKYRQLGGYLQQSLENLSGFWGSRYASFAGQAS